MSLPMYTDVSDIDVISEVLTSKIKEITIEEAQKINKKAFSPRNLSTYSFLDLVEQNASGIKLTTSGRKYSSSKTDEEKCTILIENIKKINIYDTTLEYMHHNQIFSPTKTEVGAYWTENFNNKVDDLSEDQITGTVVFFLKLCEKIHLGKFVNAGRGRETRIDFDNVKLAEYVTKKLQKKITQETNPVKSERKEEKHVGKEEKEEIIGTDESDLSPSSLRALGKLSINLSWKDLDSDGAKKLIIEKLDDLQQENTVLKAKVDKMYDIDKTNAVLREKNKELNQTSLIKTSVNSIGGIILGASISITDPAPKIIGIILGCVLVGLSIFYRNKNSDIEKKSITS